jgi:hypothetical protein
MKIRIDVLSDVIMVGLYQDGERSRLRYEQMRVAAFTEVQGRLRQRARRVGAREHSEEHAPPPKPLALHVDAQRVAAREVRGRRENLDVDGHDLTRTHGLGAVVRMVRAVWLSARLVEATMSEA